ncbi:immune inhibitor A [Vibrio lentus]|nr:immune inhibitor A [Vibrio lentus]
MIDHAMVFHASVGEEAGGGVLGWYVELPPIQPWSHMCLKAPLVLFQDRFNAAVNLFVYTIQPIDATAGFVLTNMAMIWVTARQVRHAIHLEQG